jgi:hypothetical protein
MTSSTASVEPTHESSVVSETHQTVRGRARVFPGTDRSTRGTHPGYFFVTSWGLAGSAWLASSLNLLQDVRCSGGIDHPLVSMGWYYYDGDLIERKLDAIASWDDVRHGFYRAGMRERVRETLTRKGIPIAGSLVREKPIRQLQVMYDELEQFAPGFKFYGNVHACFAVEALEYLAQSPTRRDVRVMNLIRHPLPRTEATFKGLLNVATLHRDSDWHTGIPEAIDGFTELHSEMRREIEKDFGMDFRQVRNRAVLFSYHGVKYNDLWVREIVQFPDLCHVMIERLMMDRDYFSWFVAELTGGELCVPSEFLDRIHSEEHLATGRHIGRGRTPGPRAQYDAWNPWERHEFRQVMKRLDFANVYAAFGYDFSFVR